MFTLSTHFECDKVYAKPRPRFNMRTGVVYSSPAYRAYEQAIGKQWRREHGNATKFFEGAVYADIVVTRKLPASTPKRILCDADVSRPDVDNIAKGVLDALNGIAYPDDSIVVRLATEKRPRMRQSKETIDIRLTFMSLEESLSYENN